MKRRSAPANSVIQQLKEDYEQQIRNQKKAIQAETEFFEKARKLEMDRHNEAMLSLEQNQAKRIAKLRQHEQLYERQLNDLRRTYAAKKTRMKQTHNHEMKMLEDENASFDEIDDGDEEQTPDTFFAESVITEILRLRDEKASRKRSTRPMPKLRDLVDELESHFKILHSVMNSSGY